VIREKSLESNVRTTAEETSKADRPAGAERRAPRSMWQRAGSLDRYVIVLVWVAIVIYFGIERPHVFLTELTFKTTLADNAATCALAVGVTIALAAGVIDLSFAAMAGLSMVIVTKLSATSHLNILLIALIAVAACAALGAVTSLLVTWLKVNSLVATLGMMSVAIGLTEKITAGMTLTGRFSGSFTDFGQAYWGPFPRPFVYAMALAVLGYLVLEHTPFGRRLLAVGDNVQAARLIGIRVGAHQTAAILTVAAIAGLVGVTLASTVGQATDTSGTGYLLPVVAGVFLGSTQFKNRVNVVGSVVAVLTIGTGIKGLQLMGATPWVSDFFDGAVLLAAVAFGAIRTRSAR